MNFAFLDPHPVQNKVFRTNARLDETFDPIGLFCRDQRLPTYLDNASMGQHPRGPDYGVFDFANLFSDALNKQSLNRLSHDKKGEFLARFEHKVSDHTPL